MGKEQGNIEEKVKEYVNSIVPSFVAWDILQFLYANPETEDSLSGVAKNIGRTEEDVQKGLDALVEMGLVEVGRGKEKVYLLTKQESTMKKIEEFMIYCQDPQNRLRIVCKLLDLT